MSVIPATKEAENRRIMVQLQQKVSETAFQQIEAGQGGVRLWSQLRKAGPPGKNLRPS
jgi:hypothetical protein